MFQITNPPPFLVSQIENEVLFGILAILIVAGCIIAALAELDKEEKPVMTLKKGEKPQRQRVKNTGFSTPNRSRYRTSSRRP